MQVAFRRRRASSAAATIRAREAISSSRVAALAIAVATRSANSPMRASVSGGNGSDADEPTIATPHTWSPTMIGTPTAERIPSRRICAAASPDALSWLSMRAVRPASNTNRARLSPWNETADRPRLHRCIVVARRQQRRRVVRFIAK